MRWIMWLGLATMAVSAVAELAILAAGGRMDAFTQFIWVGCGLLNTNTIRFWWQRAERRDR
jgi:hypothetical protein